MISRAAGLSKDEIKALRSALQASQAENKVLKAENKALKSALQRLGSKSSASKTRQVKRSVAGQVKSAIRKPMISSVRIKAPKVDVERQKKQHIEKARQARKEMLKNMTSEQRRQFYMNTIYMPQFIERLDNFFGISGKFTDEQKQMLNKVLPRFTKEQLETIIRDNLGLETIMYESEGNYSYDDINENLDANDIFKEIMDGAENLGLLSPAELLYIKHLTSEYGLDEEFNTQLLQAFKKEQAITGIDYQAIYEKADATDEEHYAIEQLLDKYHLW